MFIISRSENFVTKFWTGSNWSTNRDEAKEFDTWEAGKAEMTQVGVVFPVNINKKK